MGAVESLGALCLAGGLALGGMLVALSSPRVAFLVVGLGAVGATATLLRLSRRIPHASSSDREGAAAESPNRELGETLRNELKPSSEADSTLQAGTAHPEHSRPP